MKSAMRWPAIAGLAVTAALPALSQAQSQQALYAASLAATCANCHGTQGRTVEGSPVAALAGTPHNVMVARLKAFKDGSQAATIMHQLAKGYSDAQIEQIAAYFAAQTK